MKMHKMKKRLHIMHGGCIIMQMVGVGWGDAGAASLYRSIPGTLSLYEDAAVLTHQNTVRKDRRLHQGLEYFYISWLLLLGIETPGGFAEFYSSLDCIVSFIKFYN